MRRTFLACLLAAALAGCASVPAERGKDLSSAGVAYARATSAVIDQAIDAVIDVSSERRLPLARDAAQGAAIQERKDSLLKVDQALIDNVRQYANIKRSVGAIEAYFAALQELAGATPGDAVEASVQTLADRVNGASMALGGEAKLDEGQKAAVAGLGKLLVKQAHGAAVARALERDAGMIGRALVLQQVALQIASDDLRQQAAFEAVVFYRERVVGPYVAGGVGQGWKEDRRTYIKAAALGTASDAMQTASQAASQMESVWGRILGGQSSGKEFMLLVNDVNEALAAAQALKKAF